LGKDNPAAQGDGQATGTLEKRTGEDKTVTTRRGAAIVIDGCRAPVIFLSALTGGAGTLLK
jgi:hypothetical protein